MNSPQYRAVLALGANLGNRRKTLEDAWRKLNALPETKTELLSSFYKTKAIGGPKEQPDFLNAVGTIRTALEPLELLDAMNHIETLFGRTREIHWGPRTLDLDLIFYDQLILKTERLTIPHPLFSQRLFVLQPMAEIVPDWTDPVSGKTTADLLKTITSKPQ